jgi:Asp-tRNA(Asn)/Glu-tRNA(Gln) amidotransferase A subunit family amidase
MTSNHTAEDSVYDLKSVKLPKLSGTSLRLLTAIMESRFSSLAESSLLDKAGVLRFRTQQYDEPPTFYPTCGPGNFSVADEYILPALPESPEPASNGFRFNSVTDYARAYREGKITPADIARKFLESASDSDTGGRPLRAFIALNQEDMLKQAEESSERFRKGNPLSILDGVPVSVKDQFKVSGYPRTIGTSFMGSSVITEDATPVARLRTAGAIIAGKTNMHELGLGVTGLNPHHGIARNPYNPGHYTGGSSSGPAAAVAAGLGPASLGADGGGSIRIPASFCGLVGLKPTFGRVSMYGDSELCWSIEYVSPLAATASDAAIIYGVVAGPDPKDPLSVNQPAPSLSGWDNTDLGDLTVGIYPQWFEHADPETVSICKSLLEKLERSGVHIREIAIPGLEAGRVAHTITIAAEIGQSLERYHAGHSHDYGMEVRLNLAIARKFNASDYLRAQRVRTRMMADFSRILEKVDVIITPTAGLPAPAIPEHTLPEGESDLTSLFEIMRFATPTNMNGLPSISFPAGYTVNGLPVGMQATGRAWQETTLLRLALAAETLVERKAPMVYYDLLADS